jgi:hypothetical protein
MLESQLGQKTIAFPGKRTIYITEDICYWPDGLYLRVNHDNPGLFSMSVLILFIESLFLEFVFGVEFATTRTETPIFGLGSSKKKVSLKFSLCHEFRKPLPIGVRFIVFTGP